jgi:outer membrane protein assembly factor BamB
VWCGDASGDLVIVAEVTDDEDGWGFVARIGKNGGVTWVTRLVSYNLGTPGVDDRAVYVSTRGMVGRLDATSGAFLWKHDGLSAGEYPLMFGPPVKLARLVRFPVLRGQAGAPATPEWIDVEMESGKLTGFRR